MITILPLWPLIRGLPTKDGTPVVRIQTQQPRIQILKLYHVIHLSCHEFHMIHVTSKYLYRIYVPSVRETGCFHTNISTLYPL